MKISCKDIPTYDLNKKKWSNTSFKDQYEFGDFLLTNCFKEPGEYQFHKSFTQGDWITVGKKFDVDGRYTDYSEDTQDYWDFWEEEEMKCRLGVLWKYQDRWYYTTRDYYFMINFFRIVNKEIGYQESFADVRDGQYHMMLYEKLAEIFNQNACILKRRQFIYSNCHVAKSINYLFFENNKRIKWFAYDGKYIDNVNGSWYMLDIAKKHLNLHTGWYKDFSPDTSGKIIQRIQVKEGKGHNWRWEGNESSIVANTMAKDPASGVGGPTYWAWYEEGGIAPTADITFGFIDPALLSGGQRVGSFAIGGSVGDLKQCAPLKKYIENPEVNGFLGVSTTLYNKDGVPRICGLFIPAQYCMPEAMDEHGNSLPELALQILDKSENIGWKKGEMKGSFKVVKDEEPWIKQEEKAYILKKSQNPRTIEEAFDYRGESYFNAQLALRRQQQIEMLDQDKKRYVRKGLFVDDKFIDLKDIKINPPNEMIYPVDPTLIDKRGVVNIYEDYKPGCEYYAGVDAIDAEITRTSESLFSMHIYRRSYDEFDLTTGKKKSIPGRIVACWAGRFDTSDETNEHGMQLLLMYRAKASCERNKPNFINHCKRRRASQFIATTKELPFDKDIDITGRENGQCGVWRDSGGKVLHDLLRVTKDYFNGEQDVIYLDTLNDEDEIGKIKKIIRGYDFIDDYWTLEEIKKYNTADNFDRVDSLMYAIHYGTANELTFDKKTEVVQSNPNKTIQEKPGVKVKPARNMLGDLQGRYSNKQRNLLKY